MKVEIDDKMVPYLLERIKIELRVLEKKKDSLKRLQIKLLRKS